MLTLGPFEFMNDAFRENMTIRNIFYNTEDYGWVILVKVLIFKA